MRNARFVVAATLAALAATGAALAQSREYRVGGTVVDTQQRPLAGATVEIRERTTRQAFRVKTGNDGAFKMVGLPHGIFEVTITLAGYQARTDEWDLTERQDTMKKVSFNPYVLASDAEVAASRQAEAVAADLEQAKARIRAGDAAGALSLLAKVLAARPDDAVARFLAGLCHLQRGEAAAALPELERAVALNPSLAAAHTNLGICHEQLGDTAKALASYEAALALDTANPIALYNAGVLRFNGKDAAGALPYFERVLSLAPDDDRALEMAGYCELQGGNWAKALAHLERARPLVTDPARAAAIDEIVRDLRPRVQGAPGGGGA